MYVATPLRAIFDDGKTPAKRVVWQNKATGKLVVKLVKPNRFVDIPTSARVLGSISSPTHSHHRRRVKTGGNDDDDEEFEIALLDAINYQCLGSTLLWILRNHRPRKAIIEVMNRPEYSLNDMLPVLRRQIIFALFESEKYKNWLENNEYNNNVNHYRYKTGQSFPVCNGDYNANNLFETPTTNRLADYAIRFIEFVSSEDHRLREIIDSINTKKQQNDSINVNQRQIASCTYFSVQDYFDDFMASEFSVNSGEPVIDDINGPYRIYIIGDLDGRLMSVVKLFLDLGLIHPTSDGSGFKWIAPENVYVVQCGDQIDALRIDGRENQPELDVSVILFFEYMRHLSGNRVVSIIGNHEIMNVIEDFGFVHKADFKKLSIDNRKQVFKLNKGICGRALRNRFFAFSLGAVVFSHGCIDLEKMKERREEMHIIRDDFHDVAQFCRVMHTQFQKACEGNEEFNDFYDGYLEKREGEQYRHCDPGVVTWCRDDGGNLQGLSLRRDRLTQNRPKHKIYVRGHDKTCIFSPCTTTPALRKFSWNEKHGFDKHGFENVAKNVENGRIDGNNIVDVMADAYPVSRSDSLPYGIIDVDAKGQTSLTSSTVNCDLSDPLIRKIVEVFNGAVDRSLEPR